jgi:formate/nitrite transporter FocA (FNT family)
MRVAESLPKHIGAGADAFAAFVFSFGLCLFLAANSDLLLAKNACVAVSIWSAAKATKLSVRPGLAKQNL